MLNGKNSSKINRNSKILIAVTAFLAILYVLSFTKSCSSQDKREKVKTALVNQKYKESINSIILQDATGALELSNQKGFWILSINDQITIPASEERVNNLLEELTKVRNLYKISDKINKNSSLGLTTGTEFHLRYSYSGEGSYRELIFGNQDFSLSSRYLMSGENTQVYEIDSSMDNYLTTSAQAWAEPYIISHQVTSTDIQKASVYSYQTGGKNGRIEDTQKLLDLRHGGLPSPEEVSEIESESEASKKSTLETEIEIENGDKSRITLEIFRLKNTENNFVVKASYFKPDSKTAFYSSYSKISSWTYNKIKEITL